MASDCPFCGRIKRGEYDQTLIQSVVSFEPLNPVTEGHRLFVPLAHFEHSESSSFAVVAYTVGRCMESAEWHGLHQGEDFNLITSSGTHATQTVPHIHIHYVPRREADGLHLPWTNQNRGEQHG